jgi:hypothetical protein
LTPAALALAGAEHLEFAPSSTRAISAETFDDPISIAVISPSLRGCAIDGPFPLRISTYMVGP